MIVYVITNKINGKQYVGQTVQPLENRWSAHKSDSSGCLGLKAAFEKHGIENFTIEQIGATNSLEELNKIEREQIKALGTLSPNGYNLTSGGEQPKFSLESRAKMSRSHLGKKPSVNARKAASERWKGKNNPNANGMTEEHRLKLSLSAKGNSARGKIAVKCMENGVVYSSISNAAQSLSINVGHLHQVLNGKRKSAKGYTFTKVL
jgi:group I intron endonuclease